jgi:hypothetical protein
LVQARLGWDAVNDFLEVLLPLCQVEFVDTGLHTLGATRCRQARLRNLSLTDCISLEYMKRLAISTAIAHDEHFTREHVALPRRKPGRLSRRCGGDITLKIIAGQGHNMWPGWFQCQELVNFVIANLKTNEE